MHNIQPVHGPYIHTPQAHSPEVLMRQVYNHRTAASANE